VVPRGNHPPRASRFFHSHAARNGQSGTRRFGEDAAGPAARYSAKIT